MEVKAISAEHGAWRADGLLWPVPAHRCPCYIDLQEEPGLIRTDLSLAVADWITLTQPHVSHYLSASHLLHLNSQSVSQTSTGWQLPHAFGD